VPRRIFPAGTVTNTTGAALRLTFYATSTTNRRETDLWTIDSSNNLSERIPNGVIIADTTGAYSAFAGPDDIDTLYLNAHTGASRSAITASDYISSLANAYVPAVVMPAATGVAATDAANFVAALARVPSTGGVIQLLATTATAYNFTSGVTISKPVTLRGWGGSNGPISAGAANSATYLTRITSSSTTGDAITVTSDGCVFENFAMVNTATPSAGSGITVTTGGAGTRYRNVTIGGFYRNWDIAVGHEWFMDGCVSYDFVKTGLRIKNTVLPDGGDMGIVNSQFIAGPNNLAPQSGVEWCSGGGLRMVGCKINKRTGATLTLGLFLHPDDGISTSVFTIAGNSIEGCSYGIYCDDTGNTGTGTIGKITIAGNEFSCATKCIAFSRTSSGKLKTISVTGNAFTAGATTGISLGNVDSITLSGNQFDPAVTTQLSISAGVTNLFLGPGFSFTTAARPVATIMRAGSTYYDTTLLRPVWSNGTSWYQGLAAIAAGTATLVGGTVTVADASITANSIILLASKTLGGTPGAVYVSAKSAGASFDITSTSGTDTSTIQYYIKTY
jgi:hypothetical protein